MTRLRDSGLLRAGAPQEVGRAGAAAGAALAAPRRSPGRRVNRLVRVDRDHVQPARRLPVPGGRDELFGGGQGVAAGVWAPSGRARETGGVGVTVSGRWAFCSGITHADLLFAGCFVEGDARDRAWSRCARTTSTSTTPGTRSVCAAPGVTDAAADDVFVPERFVFSLFDGPVLERPLYRFPIFGFFALSIGAAALGNARAAIEELVARPSRPARDRTARWPSGGRRSGRSPWRTRHCAPRGPSTTTRSTPRGRKRSTKRRSRRMPQRPSFGGHARGPHVGRGRAVDVRPGRGTAIYDDAALQRRFRDAHTATAHFQVNEVSRELPGRILLGQRQTPRRCEPAVEGVLPYWLDRPDTEALDIAAERGKPG